MQEQQERHKAKSTNFFSQLGDVGGGRPYQLFAPMHLRAKYCKKHEPHYSHEERHTDCNGDGELRIFYTCSACHWQGYFRIGKKKAEGQS